MSARAVVAGVLIFVGTASATPHKKHKHHATTVADADMNANANVNVNVSANVSANANVNANANANEPPQTGSVAPPAAVRFAAPVQKDYEMPPRRWGMMGGGIALFAVAYAADAGVTYGFHHEPGGVSLVPLVGPLIQCGEKYGYQGPMPMTGNAALDKQMADQIASANTLIQTVTYVGLALDFAGQLAGLTLTLVGALTHHRPSSASSVRVAATGHGLSVAF